MRLFFLGTPGFAVRTLDALLTSPHDVVAVMTQPDRPRGRGHQVSGSPVKRRAETAGIPVFQPTALKDPDLHAALRALEPDLGVVAAYGRLIPQALLDLPRLGMVNVHASLLPAWRGAAPIARAIMAGESETGVTIMRVVLALDAGAMLATVRTAIDPNETAESLDMRLGTLGARLLVDTLGPIAEGTLAGTPQDDSQATYAPRITKMDGLIDWDAAARAVHDRVRGLVPWPRAYTFVDGQRLVIHETRPHATLQAAWTALDADGRHLPDLILQPGQVGPAPRGALLVGAGEGTIVEIRRLQEEGRKVLTSRDLLTGRQIPPGTRFSSHGTA